MSWEKVNIGEMVRRQYIAKMVNDWLNKNIDKENINGDTVDAERYIEYSHGEYEEKKKDTDIIDGTIMHDISDRRDEFKIYGTTDLRADLSGEIDKLI